MSLVFSGSQANAKLIFFPDTYKIKTQSFPVFLCHLLSHDLHTTGKQGGSPQVPRHSVFAGWVCTLRAAAGNANAAPHGQ